MERIEDALIGSSGQINSNNQNIQNFQNGDVNNTQNNNNSNNNNNNSNLNNCNNNMNNNNMNGTQNERPSFSYTMPGILHYLQHEWNRYELDRQQWDVEKAEFMTKISFLQGERRGQENLKNNLVRRIKMLEVALKQERVKYQKLKFGGEPNQNELKLPTSNAMSNNNDDNNDEENSSFSIAQHPILNKENTTTSSTKQGRQVLKQYLQEIGFTDTIIDVRSARLRTLLGLKSNSQNNSALNLLTNPHQPHHSTNDNFDANDPLANLIHGNKQLLQLSNDPLKQRTNINNSNVNFVNNGTNNGSHIPNDVQKMLQLNENDAQSMLMMTNLDFLSNQNEKNNPTRNTHITNNLNNNKDDSNTNIANLLNGDDEDEEMNEVDDATTLTEPQSKVITQNNSYNYTKTLNLQMNDPETEDALKEFSFLTNETSEELAEDNGSSDGSDWNVDQAQLHELKEQYKKDRKSTKNAKQQQQNQNQILQTGGVSSQRPNKATLQAMIANLNENTSENQQNNSSDNDSGFKSSGSNINNDSGVNAATNQLNNMSFSNSTKLFLEDDGFANDSNLGELSRISVNNSNSNLSNDETIISDQTLLSKKTINNKFSLRGHFDAVRCLAFHPTESALITGSEDQTIKLWNLDKSSISNKKNSNADIESVYTFRKHKSTVLSVIMSSNGDYMLSSGLDSQIHLWNMPNFETIDQYDAYSPSVYVKSLNGHTDAVWSMILVDNTLVSISADATIRIWNPFGIDELDEASSSPVKCINESKEEGIPTSIDFINNEKSRIVTSFGDTHHNVYDIETSKVICRLDYADSDASTYCYKVLSHPETSNVSSSLVLSAHEDKKIRFFDTNSGKMVHQIVAHQDACTDLAIDPTSFYLLSSSHDCSLRLWNLDNKNCFQEMTAHRKKNDESIHCIAFHPTKPFIASGGADAIVKIYV